MSPTTKVALTMFIATCAVFAVLELAHVLRDWMNRRD